MSIFAIRGLHKPRRFSDWCRRLSCHQTCWFSRSQRLLACHMTWIEQRVNLEQYALYCRPWYSKRPLDSSQIPLSSSMGLREERTKPFCSCSSRSSWPTSLSCCNDCWGSISRKVPALFESSSSSVASIPINQGFSEKFDLSGQRRGGYFVCRSWSSIPNYRPR